MAYISRRSRVQFPVRPTSDNFWSHFAILSGEDKIHGKVLNFFFPAFTACVVVLTVSLHVLNADVVLKKVFALSPTFPKVTWP